MPTPTSSGRATLTGAQFVTVLHRIVDPEAASADFANAKNETGFADVEDGMFYTAAANWAVANKIVTGVDGVEFSRTPRSIVDRGRHPFPPLRGREFLHG